MKKYEIIEDVKYIFKMTSENFKSISMIKFTIIPAVGFMVAFLNNYIGWLDLPKWIWVLFTLFAIVLHLLFKIARTKRLREIPNINIRPTFKSITTTEMQRGNLDGPRPHDLFLVIKNISQLRVDGVKIKLMKIILDNSGWIDLQKPLTFLNHEDNNKGISINANDEERAFLGNHLCDKKGGIFRIWDIEHLNQASIIFVIQVSSTSFPAFTKRFILKHDKKYNSLELGEQIDE